MASSTRTIATFTTRSATSGRIQLRNPKRIAMVWLGSAVLGASILGTIVGHVLSAPAPI